MVGPTAVYIEAGTTRVFACAVEWPGWCRSGKDEERALASMAASAPRYAVVAKKAGVRFPGGAGDRFDVVQRLAGSATTDFGAPGHVAAVDGEPLTRSKATRLSGFVEAAWAVFDEVVAKAPPTLTKGPRGGGRDRDAIVEHVVSAEASYARKIDVTHKPAADDREAIEAMRHDILAVLRRESDGSPVKEKGWPVRYAVRRIAWHVIDHAWEIEDRMC